MSGRPEGEDFGMERRTRNGGEQKFTVCNSRRKKIIQSRKTNVSIAHGGGGGGGKLGALDSFVVTLNLFPTLVFFSLCIKARAQ